MCGAIVAPYCIQASTWSKKCNGKQCELYPWVSIPIIHSRNIYYFHLQSFNFNWMDVICNANSVSFTYQLFFLLLNRLEASSNLAVYKYLIIISSTVINGVLTAPFCRRKKFKVGGAVYTRYTNFRFMPFYLALCLAMSPSSVIGVLTHHSETRTTLKFVCHLGLKVIFLIDFNM